jgi:hypothetical protein
MRPAQAASTGKVGRAQRVTLPGAGQLPADGLETMPAA